MDDNSRPFGVDPDEEPRPVHVEGIGTVLMGYIPRGKYVLLCGERMAAMTKLGARYGEAKDDDSVAWHREAVDVLNANWELCRWIVKGWMTGGLNALSLTEATYRNRQWSVLTDESLDLLESRDWLADLANACQNFWTLQPEEKKRSRLSAVPTPTCTDAESAAPTPN